MNLTDQDALHAAHLQGVLGVLQTMPIRDIGMMYGINIADLELVVDNRPWRQPNDRRAIKSALDALMQGGLDNMMVPRLELPAEYIASWIAVMVSPMNHLTACAFYDRPRRAADMAAQESQDSNAFEGLTPVRLFALVQIIISKDTTTQQAMREIVVNSLIGAKQTVVDPEELGGTR